MICSIPIFNIASLLLWQANFLAVKIIQVEMTRINTRMEFDQNNK